MENQGDSSWWYPKPTLPLEGGRVEALAYLRACCEKRGAQAELARLTGFRMQSINAAVKGRDWPSATLAVALERVLGLPAAWWGMDGVWTWERAREALADAVKRQPYPGRVAGRLGVSEEVVGELIAGTALPTQALALRILGACGAPVDVWPGEPLGV